MTLPSPDLPLAADFPAATEAQWRALVDKVLKGQSFERRLVSRTADGLSIAPLYTRSDALAGAGEAMPGQPPFTRGGLSGLQGWDIRQLHPESDPDRANAAILEDLQGGVSSVLLQIAAPGQTGLAPGGEALARALRGVMLDVCAVALRAGAGFLDASRGLEALWREAGLSNVGRRGAFNADPLGTLAATGALADPIEKSLQAAAGLAADALATPEVTALLADGCVYHAGGATEAQALACTLSTLVAYLRALEAAGIAPAQALTKIAVNVAVDADQFLSITSLRAARRLVWRVADACGAGDAAGLVHFNAETASRMMARRDPWVNMLRTTIACASAAMGGADAITVLPFTWAMGRPDPFARRIARNTHLVLQEESGLGRVADPAGGSWYVEKLTDDLSRRAWEIFQTIEARGGMVAALTSGLIQDEIAKAAEKRADEIAKGRQELTGVSAFPQLAEDGVTAEPWPEPPSVIGPLLVSPLPPRRLAEPFEALRDRADAYAARHGACPRVFLCNLGEAAAYGARSTWVKNFLAAGGIEAVAGDGFTNSADAMALKRAGAAWVYLAGRPGALEGALKAAGVDGFWVAGQDAVAVLGELQRELGVHT